MLLRLLPVLAVVLIIAYGRFTEPHIPPEPPVDINCAEDEGCAPATIINVGAKLQAGMGAPTDALPQVLRDGRGNMVAVWRAFDGARHNIWANTYHRGGAWDTPQPIELLTEDAGEVHVSLGPNGDGFAVWDQPHGKGNFVWAARYRQGAGWETPIVISTQSVHPDFRAFAARVVTDERGHAVVTWRQFDREPFAKLWSNYYAPGSGWVGAAPIAFQ